MKTFKNCFLLFAFFAFILLPANAFAGDYAQLNFIGFSKNGKYLAFEEYGTQDGSGFPYSNIYIVDVEKNAFAAPPVRKRIDNESATENAVRLMAKNAVAANLKKFNIVQGNTGKLVVARLLTDLDVEKIESSEEKNNQTVKFVEERLSNYAGSFYELHLRTSKVNLKRCDYDVDNSILKFELGLKNEIESTENILQKDATVPENRGCPHTYSIQNVYLYENRIAVFMNMYTMGFEGPDMRYLVVTGNYK